jgi:hypothetical protein
MSRTRREIYSNFVTFSKFMRFTTKEFFRFTPSSIELGIYLIWTSIQLQGWFGSGATERLIKEIRRRPGKNL